MNARQEAKLSMYRAVEKHVNENTTITNTNAAFTAAFSTFSKKIANLQGSETVVSKQTKGVSADKSVLKTILCRSAADLAALVFAYANKTQNNTLKQEVNYSVSDFKKMSDDLIAPACKNIANAANSNLAALADYGVTAAMISDFEKDMANYSAAVPMPQNVRAAKTTETAAIKATIKEIDDVLKNEMDKLVTTFKTAEPKFVSTYLNVRVIIDPKTGKPFLKK